jgi:hypothetical protein
VEVCGGGAAIDSKVGQWLSMAMVAEHVVASVIRQVRSFGSEVEFKFEFEFERLIDGVLYCTVA